VLHAAALTAIATTAVIPKASAKSVTFDENFKIFTWSPDGSKGWMTTFPYAGESARTLPNNHEAEYYSDSTVGVNPFSVNSGILTITAAPAAQPNPYNLPYTSGLITTYKSFHQTYGLFEIRAKLPAGQGLWPAFWLLPSDDKYTAELDAFEVLGSNPSQLFATVHGYYGTQPDGAGRQYQRWLSRLWRGLGTANRHLSDGRQCHRDSADADKHEQAHVHADQRRGRRRWQLARRAEWLNTLAGNNASRLGARLCYGTH
jgi:hypothetical protein